MLSWKFCSSGCNYTIISQFGYFWQPCPAKEVDLALIDAQLCLITSLFCNNFLLGILSERPLFARMPIYNQNNGFPAKTWQKDEAFVKWDEKDLKTGQIEDDRCPPQWQSGSNVWFFHKNIFISHALCWPSDLFWGRFFLLLILGVCFYFGPFDEVLFNCILGEAIS